MKHGIICIETEWQITKRGNRRNLNSEPLMKYISEMYGIPYISGNTGRVEILPGTVQQEGIYE